MVVLTFIRVDLDIEHRNVRLLRFLYNWNFSDNGNITRYDQIVRFTGDVSLAVF